MKNSKFKGIWMPIEVIENMQLTNTEKIVISIIIGLDLADGCYATNQYFANKLGLSKNRISVIINSMINKEVVISKIDKYIGNRRILTTIYKNKDTLSLNKSIAYIRNQGHPVHVNTVHNKIINKKNYKKKERDISHFNFLNKSYSKEIQRIKNQYLLIENEWRLCIAYFNEKQFNKITVNGFEKCVNSWKNNLNPKSNESTSSGLIKSQYIGRME